MIYHIRDLRGVPGHCGAGSVGVLLRRVGAVISMLTLVATIAGLLVCIVWMLEENREDKRRIKAERERWEI